MPAGKVLITRRVPASGVELLTQAGLQVDIIDQDEPASRDEILARVRGVDAVVTMLSERVDPEFLEAAGPQLKIVANFAVGFDNLDLATLREANIAATNTPGVLTAATADLTWALILAAGRRVVEADQFVRAGTWQGWAPQQYLGLELSSATLGIVGAGRIGMAVALRSLGFNMKVVYSHPRRNEDLERWTNAEHVALDDLVDSADVVSLHIPMRPENHHLIDARQFERMKPSAVFVNTARGPVVDEPALVAALQNHQIAAAGLDVYEHEPRLHPQLAELDNVVILPHLGSATHATRSRMSTMVAENIIAVLEGGAPINPID